MVEQAAVNGKVLGSSPRPGALCGKDASLEASFFFRPAYLCVGMTNSEPLRMPVGQRVVTVLTRV